MSSFTAFSAPLDTRYDAEASASLGADHWRVLREFRFWAHIPRRGRVWVTVPAGYLTDGASVPRLLWSLIPPWGQYGQAAVVHDLLCEYLAVMTDAGELVAITRAECDQLFLEAMRVLGVPSLRRHTMHTGVSAYRIVSGTHRPTATPIKRRLEAQWPLEVNASSCSAPRYNLPA